MIGEISGQLLKLPRRFKSLYLNLSMRKKLLYTFVMISLIPIVLLGSFYYTQSYNSLIVQKVMASSNLLRNVTRDTVETAFKVTDYSLIQLSDDETVQRLVQMDSRYKHDRDYQNDITTLKKLFMANTFRKHVDYIGVVGNNSFHMASSPEVEEHMMRMIYQEEFVIFKEGILNYWRGPINRINGNNYRIIARKVFGEDKNEVTGYLFMWINEGGLHQVYDRYRDEITGELLIVNLDGTIFSSTNPNHFPGRSINEFYAGLDLKQKDPQHLSVGGNKYIINSFRNDGEGVLCINAIPLSVVVQGTNKIVLVTAAITLALSLISFLLATYLSRYFTVPILKLSESMAAADIGKVSTDFIPEYDDEIGYLTHCFNRMAVKLNHQAKIIEHTQRKQREAEMKAFEGQIKPHFLYNTLSTVIWLIRANQHQDAIKITSALSKMFRISISRGKNIIPISKELQHASNYLDIQKVRYGNEFSYQFLSEEIILDRYTVKMILQPLIENSIYHGMRYREQGKIEINCFQKNKSIIMQVKDNGERMTEKQCLLINERLHNHQPDQRIEMGIGIKNVHDRIRYTYGDEYGLHYKRVDGWTIAEITIPIQEDESLC